MNKIVINSDFHCIETVGAGFYEPQYTIDDGVYTGEVIIGISKTFNSIKELYEWRQNIQDEVKKVNNEG